MASPSHCTVAADGEAGTCWKNSALTHWPEPRAGTDTHQQFIVPESLVPFQVLIQAKCPWDA